MRRGAELEGVKQESELLAGLLFIDAEQVEHPALDTLIMNTD